MKINKTNFLFLRANKILKNHYKEVLNGRDLTKEEIVAEAKNLLRKNEKENLDNDQSYLFHRLEKSEWEKIANF